jgi:hypothetical protein
MGSTGANIQRHLYHLAALLGSVGVGAGVNELPLVIANPVPYPTSCRLSLVKHWAWRDQLFSEFMKLKVIQTSFHQRLRDYRPVAIINACTGNVTHLVRDEIRKALKGKVIRPVIYKRVNIEERVNHKAYYVVRRDQRLEDELAANWPGQTEGSTPVPLIELDHPSSWNATIKEWHIVPDLPATRDLGRPLEADDPHP